MGAHGVLCHYFTGTSDRPQGALTLEDWEALLDAYGPRLVPAEEWMSRALRGIQQDEVCVTLDDGLAEGLLALPSLQRRGLTAWWGIYTGPLVGVPNRMERYRAIRNEHGVEVFYEELWKRLGHRPDAKGYLADRTYLSDDDRRFRYWRNVQATPQGYEEIMDTFPAPAQREPWLTAEEIRDLWEQDHVIGFHSHSHPTTVRGMTREQQALEYQTSQYVLGHVLYGSWYSGGRQRVDTMSHPCGEVTKWGLRYLSEMGVRLAWGATMAGALPLQAPRWSTGYWPRTPHTPAGP